jgi:hypothetical protein
MNPFFYFVNQYSATNATAEIIGTTLVPFLPGFSYSLKF